MRALITGIGGQDGTYLAELLVAEGYEVHGTSLGGSPVAPLPHDVEVHEVDQRDGTALRELVCRLVPDEVYNLAALSSVGRAWREPELAGAVNGLGAAALLDACFDLKEGQGLDIRFVQASSAEIFGEPATSPQDEATPIAPTNPYGASKAYAHQMTGIYRGRGLHASACILYNHESPRRSTDFVTRKITSTVARIAQGSAEQLVLGNQEARRDWGWSPDYVRALHLAARADDADDFVVATGTAHSVRDFVAAAFAAAGVQDWEDRVETSPDFYRPTDAFELVGDPTHAREQLGWEPTVPFDDLVARMVAADLEQVDV